MIAWINRLNEKGSFIGCMIVLCGLIWASAARSQGLPDGKGKEVVANVCIQCHSLSYVTDSRLTKADWEYIVTDMVGRGAPLMEDEIPTVIDYLSANFAKPSKVNVNTATAKELQAGLGFSPLESEAIAAHRTKTGKFAALTDLQKVEGLDGKKVDAVKDRIEF